MTRSLLPVTIRHVAPCVALLVPLAVPAQPAKRDSVALTEWNVPWGAETRPRDPSLDALGRVWFVGQEGNYVARFEPKTRKFERFEIDPGTNPHTVNVDPQGDAWYAGNRNGMIGKIDGKTGKITRYPMPNAEAKDPHTITFDAKGNLWFTLQNSNMVGYLDKASGEVKLVTMRTAQSRPYGIVLDKRGRPWFDLFGTNKIGTIDPISLRVREYPLPDERARPRRIALTSDGAVWYGDYARGYLGKLDPVSGVVKEWALPGGATSLPYAMTVDEYDRLWFVETGSQPNKLIGFDPTDNTFFGETPLGPAAPNTVRHMIYDRATHTIWFGSDRGTIGRAVVTPAPRKPIG